MIQFTNMLKTKVSSFAYRSVLPAVINLIRLIGIQRAKRNLIKENVQRILLDNTVIHHGVTHETAWISNGTQKWGALDIQKGYLARIPVHGENNDDPTARSIKYLPSIVGLAKHEVIALAISDELNDEQLTQPIGRFKGYGYFDYSIFNEVKFELLKDPDYSIQIGPDNLFPSLKDQRKMRLGAKEDPLYKSLVSVLGKRNSQDVWHIVTAERNNCYCFLTMDFRLIENVKAQSNNALIKSLKTKVMTPEDFGKEFGLPKLSPRLFSFHSANGPVEPGLNWPDSRRRKPSADK